MTPRQNLSSRGAPSRRGKIDRAKSSARAAAQTILGDVQWTPAYVGLLAYIFAIVTFRLPIGEAAIILALVGIAVQRERLRFPPLLVWFSVFLLWALLGYAQSTYRPVVLEGWINFGKLWLIALVMVNALRTPGQVRFFAIFFLACFATHPARGAIFNYFIYGHSTFGRAVWNLSFGNPNDLAALTLLPLAIAASLLYDGNKWVRLGAKASVIVLPILILMTQSRGGFLALAVFAVLTLLGQRNKLRTAALLVMLGGTVALAAPGGVWDRISGLSAGAEADSSSEQRWLIWRIAREMIQDHPVFGVGLEAYPQAHAVYASMQPEYAFAGGTRDTHSTYLNVAAETGYVGLLIFLLVVGATLFEAERARRRAKRRDPQHATRIWYLEASLFAYLVTAIFGSFSHLSFLYIHLALLAVFARLQVAGAHQQDRVSLRRRRLRRGAAPFQPASAARGFPAPAAASRHPTG